MAFLPTLLLPASCGFALMLMRSASLRLASRVLRRGRCLRCLSRAVEVLLLLAVVLAAAQMFFDQRLPRRGDLALFRELERLGERAADCAFEPDAGLWELRTKAHVYSVLVFHPVKKNFKLKLADGS